MAEFMADDIDWLRGLARTYPSGGPRARLVAIADCIQELLFPATAAPDGPDTETARITIIKGFEEAAEGGESVTCHYSEGLSLLDALGMLAFATWATPATYNGTDQ